MKKIFCWPFFSQKCILRLKSIAKVNRLAFTDIIDSLDIGSVIYPKIILLPDYILQYVRAAQNSIGSNVETLYKILDDRAEAWSFPYMRSLR